MSDLKTEIDLIELRTGTLDLSYRNHTSGPWRQKSEEDWTVDNDDDGKCSGLSWVPIGNNRNTVAVVVWNQFHDDEEFDANISLIQHAPELHEYVRAKAENGCLEALQLIERMANG